MDIVNLRLKKLIHEKIIQGSRILINKHLLGYEYHKVLLNVRFQDKSEENIFINYLQSQNEIIDVIRMMGEWNLELDIDVKTPEEFHDTLMKLKDNFSKVI